MKKLLDLLLYLPGKWWRYRLRFKKLMDPVHLPQMDVHSLEGYLDRMVYQQGDEVKLYIKAPEGKVLLQFQQVLGGQRFLDLHQLKIEGAHQFDQPDASQQGCGWKESVSIKLHELTDANGYFRIKLSTPVQEHHMTYLVKRKTKASIAVIAPVSTWTAYNPYGGQSLYKNFIHEEQVNFVSTQRPNTACEFKDRFSIHDMHIEAGIYQWFDQEFGADLFPDFDLEQGYQEFSHYRLIVFAYHMEYVSKEMYNTVQQLKSKGHSLLFLGANQFYWKVQWLDDYRKLECHKDHRDFSRSGGQGGLWRHQLKREEFLMGARFDDRGMGSYAPYQVLMADHWLFEGTGLRKGDLFGKAGYNGLPICGDETDKTGFWTASSFNVLAKGLNPEFSSYSPVVWPDQEQNWNGKGGGEIVISEKSNQGIMNTGSIQSGAGLGYDKAFTRIIRNFCLRYAL